MLRLTILLCAGLFLALLIGGRDYGQMRPGLARAGADAVTQFATAEVPAVETVVLAQDVAAEAPPVVAAVKPAPVTEAAQVVAPLASAAVVEQVSAPLIAPKPESTVFTLSNYADPLPEAPTARDTAPGDEREIWYVDGNSVNVRSGPSTDDQVVGKLSRGEATLLVSREGEEWARIRIEGDGVEGYVAVRYLTPEVPALD